MIRPWDLEWYKPLPVYGVRNWYVIPTIFSNGFFDAGGISKKASVEINHAQNSQRTGSKTTTFHTLLWHSNTAQSDPCRGMQLGMYGSDLYATIKLNLDHPESGGTICLSPHPLDQNGRVTLNSCNTARIAPVVFELSNNTIGAEFTYQDFYAAVRNLLVKELVDDMIDILVGLQLCQRNGDIFTATMTRETFKQLFELPQQ